MREKLTKLLPSWHWLLVSPGRSMPVLEENPYRSKYFLCGPARFQRNAEGARVAGFFQNARYGQAAIGTGGVRDGAGTGHRIGGAVDHGVERGLSAVHGGCDGNYFKGGAGFVQGLHGEMVGAFLKALARI